MAPPISTRASILLEAQTSLASPAPAPQPRVPVAAIPTTYAGSEMTPVYGVTRPEADIHVHEILETGYFESR